MNIFATSNCPKKCAEHLDDKRVVKMVLETAQLLSMSIDQPFYKPTHAKHPCTLWTQMSAENRSWLIDHFEALLKEYTNRYNKVHKCAQYLDLLRKYHKNYEQSDINFVNCTPFKHINDTLLAYQMALNEKWESDKRIPTWYGVRK